MRYFLLFFSYIFLLISAPNPANAGASILAYDYNVVQSLEKTPTEKSKIKEWAKRKKPVWSKKIRRKNYKPTMRTDFETETIIASGLVLAGLIFLGIGLAAILAWALLFGGVLFVLGILLLLAAGNGLEGLSGLEGGLILIAILIIAVFLLGLALFIGGLIASLAWAWIVGLIIISLYIFLLVYGLFIA
jgi:hypothetical protein